MREIGPVRARDGHQQREPEPDPDPEPAPEPRAGIPARAPEQLIWLFQGELGDYG